MKRLLRWLDSLPLGVQLAILAAEIAVILVLSLGIIDGNPREDPAETSSAEETLLSESGEVEESVSSASSSADECVEQVTAGSSSSDAEQQEGTDQVDTESTSEEHAASENISSVEPSKDNAEGETGAEEKWGRDGKRYTELKEAKTISEWAAQKHVRISNSDLLYNISDSDRSRINSYVSAYASNQDIDADSAKILGTQYLEDGSIREFYISYNDDGGSLATIVFEEADGENDVYIDVVPCGWTREEIEKQAWMPEWQVN